MAKCCICGRKIEDLRNAVLLTEIDSEDNLICSTCENMLIGASMTESTEDIKKSFDYFAGFMEENRDEDVREYLKELLISLKESFKGSKEEEEDESPVSSEDDEDQDDYSSGVWLNILYACAWINVIIGIIASVLVGVFIGQLTDSTFGGIIAAVVGFVITFISSALVMVALNAANDIRATRQYTKEIRGTVRK